MDLEFGICKVLITNDKCWISYELGVMSYENLELRMQNLDFFKIIICTNDRSWKTEV